MKVLSFSEMCNEKLGISDEVTRTAEAVMSIIANNFMDEVKNKKPWKFTLPHEHFDEFMNEKILDLHVIYNPKFNEGFNAQMGTKVVNHKYIEATLKLKVPPTLSVIAHEIQHMYEYTRRLKTKIKDGKMTSEFEMTNRRKWYYEFDEGSLGHDGNIDAFSNATYYSLDEEINSRVQEVFHAVKNKATSKKHFIDLVKKNHNYKISKDLQGPALSYFVKNMGNDEVYDFVNKLYYVFNRQHIFATQEAKGLAYFANAVDNIFKIGFELYFKKIGHKFTKELSREEAKRFVLKWDKHFKKQGKKFERKLFKTWDMVDVDANYKKEYGEDSGDDKKRQLIKMRKDIKLRLAKVNRNRAKQGQVIIKYSDL